MFKEVEISKDQHGKNTRNNILRKRVVSVSGSRNIQ
jgi:hypothetical protein